MVTFLIILAAIETVLMGLFITWGGYASGKRIATCVKAGIANLIMAISILIAGLVADNGLVTVMLVVVAACIQVSTLSDVSNAKQVRPSIDELKEQE
ncbi:hypothetical protein QT397_02445 (plasmid) [Microbulbifer sp. MKSA007]|nr:hypothetical protein QT397_02445 [Microbulbifer sp. MKSA007]